MAEEAPTGGERTEDPSAKRREDFRQKGQVAQSKEVQTAALFSLALLFWLFYMPRFWNGLITLVTSLWKTTWEFQGTPSAIIGLSIHVTKEMAILLIPLFLLVMIIGFFSSFFQFGWLLTAKPLIPDFSKLDPITGMGRLFSKRSLIEIIKSIAKVTLIGWIAFSTVMSKFNEALILVDTDTSATMLYLARTAALILSKICAMLILLAFIDFLYVRWEMEEKLKMTKQDNRTGPIPARQHSRKGLLDLGQPPLDEALALACRMVLGVFRQVALRTRLGNRLDHGGTLNAFQMLQLGTHLFCAHDSDGEFVHELAFLVSAGADATPAGNTLRVRRHAACPCRRRARRPGW